jgi:hypothetical protein
VIGRPRVPRSVLCVLDELGKLSLYEHVGYDVRGRCTRCPCCLIMTPTLCSPITLKALMTAQDSRNASYYTSEEPEVSHSSA